MASNQASSTDIDQSACPNDVDQLNQEDKARLPPYTWRKPETHTPARQNVEKDHGNASAEDTLDFFQRRPSKDAESLRRTDRDDATRKRNTNNETLENLVGPTSIPSKGSKAFNWTSFFTRLRTKRQKSLTVQNLDDLTEIALHAFPPRMELPVLVCDITKDGAKTREIQLMDVERCWKKPDKDEDGNIILIRWIHVPLGNGVVHSSIEDMFRHDWPRGRPFRNAGGAGFPYLDLDSLHFRGIHELQHMRDVHRLLHNHPEQRLQHDLNEKSIGINKNPTFTQDLKWREGYLGIDRERYFWDNALADMPLELTENFSSGGGEGPIRPPSLGKGPLDQSLLEKHNGKFKDSHLVWAPFRCFHRKDGTLLTMSAATGVDLLHRDFESHIAETSKCRLRYPEASVIGNLMSTLEDPVHDRSRLTVENFLVYLVTEISVTPHNMVSGHSGPSLLSALQSISRDLRTRRLERWDPKKSAHLVKDNVIFLDELRALSLVYKRKISFLENLLKDVEEFEDEDKKAANGTSDTEGNNNIARRASENLQRSGDRGLTSDGNVAPQEYLRQDDLAAHAGASADENRDEDRPQVRLLQRSDTANPLKEHEQSERRPAGQPHILDSGGLKPRRRVQWALKFNKRQMAAIETLLADTKDALEPLTYIKQVEFAIHDDRRNKAVLIFTTVTIVFLPLSFFASYFGMNIKDIVDTDWKQRHFWRLFGPLTVAIILLVGMWAFWDYFYHFLLQRDDYDARVTSLESRTENQSVTKAKSPPVSQVTSQSESKAGSR